MKRVYLYLINVKISEPIIGSFFVVVRTLKYIVKQDEKFVDFL